MKNNISCIFTASFNMATDMFKVKIVFTADSLWFGNEGCCCVATGCKSCVTELSRIEHNYKDGLVAKVHLEKCGQYKIIQHLFLNNIFLF